MEGMYDQSKVRAGISAITDAAMGLDMNLLETYSACKAVMVSAEAMMVENAKDADKAREFIESV